MTSCIPWRVAIEIGAVQAMLDHAVAELPYECCGLLLGWTERIERAVTARNLRSSPTRFLVDPADHVAAIRKARAVGQMVVGAYHSHPASLPIPSARDLAEATLGIDLSVIVSPNVPGGVERQVAAYRLDGARYRRVELRILERRGEPNAGG